MASQPYLEPRHQKEGLMIRLPKALCLRGYVRVGGRLTSHIVETNHWIICSVRIHCKFYTVLAV